MFKYLLFLNSFCIVIERVRRCSLINFYKISFCDSSFKLIYLHSREQKCGATGQLQGSFPEHFLGISFLAEQF